MSLRLLLGPMRVPFLILAPACAAVGIATAFWQTRSLNGWHVLLVLLGALFAHISTNAFNEYFDFRSGLDARTRPTPFSGGSGTLPANPSLERYALWLSIITLLLTAGIGIYFIWQAGWGLLPLGLLGLLLVVSYTVWWTYDPIRCLIAPGLGFGILMVMGSHFALSGHYSLIAFAASLVPTFLVSNLLLLNQFPDVEADQSIGRRHFPITIGRQASSRLYGLLLILAYATIIISTLAGLFPWTSLLALLTAIPAWQAYRLAARHAESIPELLPAMGLNVIVTVGTPFLLALGFFLAAALGLH